MITEHDLEAFDYFDQRDDYARKAQVRSMTPMSMVEEYQKLVKQEPSAGLYAGLIDEEYREWSDAYYFAGNQQEIMKELADLVYVVYGFAYAKGWDLDEAVRRVHENNIGRMKQPDGTILRREDGKIIKNKDYPKVNLEDLA